MGKNQRNPFWFFMKAKQDEEKLKGNTFSMAEMSSLVGEIWKNMAPEEKKPYEDMCKAWKGQKVDCQTYAVPQLSRDDAHGPSRNNDRLTSIGTSLAKEMEDEEEEIRHLEYLDKLIVADVFDPNEEELLTKPFYIASTNVACKNAEELYYPLEFGIVKYSIRNGIEDVFHEFTDIGNIPMGYSSVAFTHQALHKIPLKDFAHAVGKVPDVDPQDEKATQARVLANNRCIRNREFGQVITNIKRFLKYNSIHEDLKSIKIYCLPEQIQQVKGSFDFLEREAENSELTSSLDFLSVTRLLFHLFGRSENLQPDAICDRNLRKSNFDYAINTNCAFHDDVDTVYCAVGVAKRLCYLLSEDILPAFSVFATKNHLPLRAEAATYEVFIPRQTEPGVKKFSTSESSFRQRDKDYPDQRSSSSQIIRLTQPNIKVEIKNGTKKKAGTSRGAIMPAGHIY